MKESLRLQRGGWMERWVIGYDIVASEVVDDVV